MCCSTLDLVVVFGGLWFRARCPESRALEMWLIFRIWRGRIVRKRQTSRSCLLLALAGILLGEIFAAVVCERSMFGPGDC